MKFHPMQGHKKSMDRLSEIFSEAMTKHGVLPKNPWKAKRLADWLGKMGARFHPGSHRIRCYSTDPANFVNFVVDCPPFVTKKGRLPPRVRGYREYRYVCLEIPWEMADRALALGFLP